MEFKAEHTISKILKYLLIAMVLALVLLWFIGGGVQKIIAKAHDLHFTSFSDVLSPSSALSDTFKNFKLPWAMDMPTISVDAVSDNGDNSGAPGSGNPSSHVGEVSIAQGAARTQSAAGQYIELHSASGSTVSISGWSLESDVSGARVYIPEATSLFLMGRVNSVGQVALSPGGSAIVVTGPSPVGVSFQENKCTGYLGTVQPFVPSLQSNCPSPLAAIPNTPDNQTRLGASCFQYLSQLSPCTFPQNPPASLSPACRSEIQNKLSYNGCVSQNQTVSGFSSGNWRVYLAHGTPLWGVQHDIIRLLDANGSVVDVLNY